MYLNGSASSRIWVNHFCEYQRAGLSPEEQYCQSVIRPVDTTIQTAVPMSSKQVECPECGDTYKVQGLYGHLRMGHGFHGDKLEEKYSEAVGESRGAGMQGRDVSKAPTIQQMFGPKGEGYGPADEGGALGKLRELAIARRMQKIAENLNGQYSAVGYLRQECSEKLADLEWSLLSDILEMSEEKPPPDTPVSDILGSCYIDGLISDLTGYDSE